MIYSTSYCYLEELWTDGMYMCVYVYVRIYVQN